MSTTTNQGGNAVATIADVDARPPVQAGNTEFVVRTIAPFGNPEKVLRLGGAVTGSHAIELDKLLAASQDVFA